jgi:hypothetical protein
MLLGMEIALTVMALLFLVRGKGLGKDAVSHPHYRWLGAFMLTLWPVGMGAVFGFGVAWAMTHQGQTLEEMEQGMRWPAAGLEFLVIVGYVIGASVWEKSIKRRAAAGPGGPASPA